ncbi:MAG: hypothetical protein F2667_13130 [Actinobacteria bacterium]|uniref:Unannotated protein n=1 Tax=freshwater metagenome TaxID=449393 RepID=A0A6J6S4C2_9ZZZZ|nr:hypothetical protein [Actinomycetota bacterium]
MTARDIREPGDFIRRLHDAYAAADRPRAFSWTIEPPEHWVATRSVSQRRALDDSQRRRLLRYRSG